MTPGDLDRHRDRLVGLAGDDAALTCLAAGGAALGRRGAGPCLSLATALRPVGRPAARGLLAGLSASGGSFIRALLGALVGRLARAQQAPARLPVEALELVIAALGRRLLRLLSGSLLGRSIVLGGRL